MFNQLFFVQSFDCHYLLTHNTQDTLTIIMHFSQATVAAVVAAGLVSAAPAAVKRAEVTDGKRLHFATNAVQLEP